MFIGKADSVCTLSEIVSLASQIPENHRKKLPVYLLIEKGKVL